MILVIPTSTADSWYEQIVAMDGADYRLRLRWSERERRWYLDLETSDGSAVVYGKKVVADRPLTERITSDFRPPGELWCIDTTGFGVDPDLRDLGKRCVLCYVSEEDCA